MTIGCIVLICFSALVLIGGLPFGIWLIKEEDWGVGIITTILTVLLAAALIIGPFVYMKTETGKRALKDQQSNFNNGIERVVKVYDVSGELIEQYEGKFDIETSNVNNTPYIVFDDENGKRHIIYYTTGTIIVDEK
jgi:hypothetical protein